MFLKPDRLNGMTVYRGVEMASDGVNHVNRFILFPPSMSVKHAPPQNLDALIEEALSHIISVSDQTGDPVIKAQAVTFRCALKKALTFWMKRAAINERALVRQHLVHHGLKLAATAIGESNG